MIIQAELKCKQTGCEADTCAVDKVIELPSPRFRLFSRALLADYDFIAENKNAVRHDDDSRHCLLILNFEVTDLAAAASLVEHIGDYILTPEISSPQEAAIDELNFTMDVHSAELLLPHVNLFTYGNEIIKDDNAALTSYGLLHREDYQPMQTPVQERFEMDTQQLT